MSALVLPDSRTPAAAGQVEQELVASHKGFERLGKVLKIRTTSDVIKPTFSTLPSEVERLDRTA